MAVRSFRTNDLVKEHDIYVDFMKKRHYLIKETENKDTQRLFYKKGLLDYRNNAERIKAYVTISKWHCITLTYDIWYDIAQNYAIDEGATTYKKIVDIPESMIKKFKYRVEQAIKNAECDYNKRINNYDRNLYDACRYLAMFWTYLDCIKDTKTQRFFPSLITIERARKVFGYNEKENPFLMNGRFFNYESESTEEKKPEVEEKPADVSVSINDIMLEDMNFTMRTYTCLKRHGVDNLTDILKMTKRNLLMTRNLGRHSLEEILAKVKEYGFEYPGEKFDDCKDELPHPIKCEESVVDIAEQVVKEMDEENHAEMVHPYEYNKLLEKFNDLKYAFDKLKGSSDKTFISAQELARQNDDLIKSKLEYEQYISRLKDDNARLKDDVEGLRARCESINREKLDTFAMINQLVGRFQEDKVTNLSLLVNGYTVDIHRQGTVYPVKTAAPRTDYIIRTKSEGQI